jgi:hypothetical protein
MMKCGTCEKSCIKKKAASFFNRASGKKSISKRRLALEKIELAGRLYVQYRVSLYY